MVANAEILRALHATKYVRGYTHSFYRYPAATGPELVRELIAAFSDPGDAVCDPFMGGGTVAVEALAAGRSFVGGDLNELAVFVARTKTTPLAQRGWAALDAWAAGSVFTTRVAAGSGSAGLPNPLARALASARASLVEIADRPARNLAKCAVLRVGQWALEARDEVPPSSELQAKLESQLASMRDGMAHLTSAAAQAGTPARELVGRRVLRPCAAKELSEQAAVHGFRGRVRLLLTSPPYPGVHVLYHRWQVRGRRETAAPYWVIGARDGHYLPYYTMGGRSPLGVRRYFCTLTETFAGLRPLLADDGTVAVVVGFTDPVGQEPLFHAAMAAAGYASVDPLNVPQEALVRDVPNRRWYVRGKNHAAAREVLLFYRPQP